MAVTPSTMMPLGTQAPDFKLLNVRSGQPLSLNDGAGAQGTLVIFICNHCPFVHHIEDALIEFAWDYQPRGINVIAISANDADTHPQDSPELMKDRAAAKGYPFPYLYDESQAVARAYDAACTPDLFLFDAQLRCVYRGQFDATRPGGDSPATGADLRHACDALFSGNPIDPEQHPSTGCNIKWKSEA
ncbi:MAG: thioredoxin family protein [Oceanospirillaceae bacterium]|nr:thioredoxin family protein [Oceanospirillaceae bacterium]